MFDNICTLPLTTDLFTQAIHPNLPLLSVGLSSGHVQTYRLPSDLAPAPTSTSISNGTTALKSSQSISAPPNSTTTQPPSALTPPHTRRSSGAGLDIIETLWRTRRHKGSCRSLAYSLDGHTLFSAGSDGVLKAADTLTGRVHSKIIAPIDPHTKLPEVPSVICVLSPVVLLLGTDTGVVFVYRLNSLDSSSSTTSTPNSKSSSKSKFISQPTKSTTTLLCLSAKPTASYRPHVTSSEPNFSESITSLTPLPPSATSSSGTSRAWISTAGGCVAVTDLRKGVVSCSADQGDVLLSCVCVGGVGGAGAGAGGSGFGKRKAGQVDGNGTAGAGEGKVLIGGANGSMTVWERGDMQDRNGTVIVQRDGGGLKDESTIDCAAAVPHSNRIAVGLGNGKIVFVALRGRGGQPVDSVGHDELNAEGVTTLGFDLEGRMISGGGNTVKIWQPLGSQGMNSTDGDAVVDDVNGDEEVVQMGDGSDADEDEDASGDDSEDAPKKHKKKKRRKNMKVTGKFGEHGVMAFSDLQ